jgi:hypothetical protein
MMRCMASFDSLVQCIDQKNHHETKVQIAQVAEIYASAQLTIIAAAGEDAYHGLIDNRGTMTTISTSTHSPQVSVRSLHLVSHPAPGRIDTLLSSKWASRGWTFQECYFSRRRLFFTDEDITDVCNSYRIKHLPVGWFPSSPKHVEEAYFVNGNTFGQPGSIISSYVDRQLTYEADALPAIIGALNSACREVQHIWGLLFRCYAAYTEEIGPESYVELALCWFHATPCSRRGRIPSWSPIAWAAPIVRCSNINARTYDMRLLDDPQSSTSIAWTKVYTVDDLETAPRYLRITAKMATLNLIRTSLIVGQEIVPPDQTEQMTFLTFPLDSQFDIVLSKVYWDINTSTLHPTYPIFGILFSPEIQVAPVRGPIILLVQRGATCHERIGMLHFSTIQSHHEDQYYILAHEHRYLRLLNKSTGEFSCLDLGESQHYHAPKYARFPWYRESPWEEFFVEETIVLG